MTTRVWEGQAAASAQVDAVAVSAYDVATQYQLLVAGEIIATASGGGTTIQVASALADAWNAVTGIPYATVITAASTGSDVQFTADVPGNPFTITANVTGGTGTMGTVTGQISNAGPNDWATAANWSGDAVPIAADDVVFRDSGVDVRWGLDQNAVDLDSLVIEQSYTGKIGLDRTAFVTGADGSAATGRPEYREDYLTVGWTDARIGESLGPGTPAGSTRLKLDNDKAGASDTEIFDTATSSADADMPAVRLLLGNAAAELQVRRAPGGVGVAVDDPAETATLGSVDVSDETLATSVLLGAGVTWADWTQQGGNNEVRAAATVTGTVTVLDGNLTIEGDQRIDQLDVYGGTVRPHNAPAAGAAVATINNYGGTVDGVGSRATRTWTTANMLRAGATLRADPDVVTITNLNEPTDSGTYALTVA